MVCAGKLMSFLSINMLRCREGWFSCRQFPLYWREPSFTTQISAVYCTGDWRQGRQCKQLSEPSMSWEEFYQKWKPLFPGNYQFMNLLSQSSYRYFNSAYNVVRYSLKIVQFKSAKNSLRNQRGCSDSIGFFLPLCYHFDIAITLLM